MKSRSKKRTPSRPAAKTATLAHLALLDEKQRYSVPEALSYLRTSRKSLYTLIAQGRLVPIKEGNGRGRTFIPGSEIARLSRVPTPESSAPAAA
jgi:Helix-turn-helix domain